MSREQLRKDLNLPMSKEEYVEKKGTCCPACRSNNIETKQSGFDAGCAWLDVTCFNCQSTWTEYYKLEGYDGLEKETT